MINAELIHNPYLLETIVRFNGKEPRINCQIEKYEHQPLNIWIEMVPSIFYNEMNGYNFELLFTGTKPDYEALKDTFLRAGVTSSEVQIRHKHELEDAYSKSDEITQMLKWLAENRNRRFDYEAFIQKYASFFEDPYPLIVINGKEAKIEGIPISVETVAVAKELQNTNLDSTPIVFYIDDATDSSRRAETEYLLSRSDVSERQLFYYISQKLTPLQRERIIAELGIEHPQIVYGFEDTRLKKYMENYPIADFIRTSIRIFRQETDSITINLDADNKKSNIINKEVRESINRLDAIITSLKTAEDFFNSRDNFCMPSEILAEKTTLEDTIVKWKNKKTKAVGETEIERMAVVFQYDIQTKFNNYITSVKEACLAQAEEIKRRFDIVYGKIEDFDGFTPKVCFDEAEIPACPEIKTEVMGLKEITYTEKPKDFFSGIFKKSEADSSESLKIVTSYFDQWRSRAHDLIMPIATSFMDKCTEKISNYYEDLAREYIAHLQDLIADTCERKEKTAVQLSGDERLLQIDNDWFNAFVEQLEHIERG